jgi:HAD superfamily hydrolase (TIGR01509 family)
MLQAVIFDMDGVLIDSVASADYARTRLLAERGIDIRTVPDPQGEAHKGSSLRTFLDAVERHHGVAIDREQFAREAIGMITRHLEERGVQADPALIALLGELRRKNVPLAITTSGLRESVENKLRIIGVKEYFPLIVTGSDVTAHKPDPASYLYTIEQLGVNPGHSIVFEDSSAGIQAAVAAGAKVIGFTGYNANKSALPGTVATIDSWHEISYDKLIRIAG